METVFFESIKADNKCDSNPIRERFNYSDLSLISVVYKPFNLYSSIIANNIRASYIPDFIFANLCINKIDLSNNLIESITTTSFNGIAFLSQLIITDNQLSSIDQFIVSLNISTFTHLDISAKKIKILYKKFC